MLFLIDLYMVLLLFFSFIYVLSCFGDVCCWYWYNSYYISMDDFVYVREFRNLGKMLLGNKESKLFF